MTYDTILPQFIGSATALQALVGMGVLIVFVGVVLLLAGR